MKPELQKQIFMRCPIIMRGRAMGMQHNLMCFGFDCGDGWFELIYDLAEKIEDKAQRLKSEGVHEERLPLVVQVKEKFGGLRFYVHNIYDEFDDLIDEAEENSLKICELCGKPGSTHGSSWVTTRCEACEGMHSRFGVM